MSGVRFKFCKQLTDETDLQGVRAFLDAKREMTFRHQADAARMQEMHDDLVDALRRKHAVPRGLTTVINPSYIDELDLVVIHSKETEEFEHPAATETEH